MPSRYCQQASLLWFTSICHNLVQISPWQPPNPYNGKWYTVRLFRNQCRSFSRICSGSHSVSPPRQWPTIHFCWCSRRSFPLSYMQFLTQTTPTWSKVISTNLTCRRPNLIISIFLQCEKKRKKKLLDKRTWKKIYVYMTQQKNRTSTVTVFNNTLNFCLHLKLRPRFFNTSVATLFHIK